MPTDSLIKRHAFNDLSSLSEALAQSAAATLRSAIEQHGKASLVVPGGHTPTFYLPRLAQMDLPWQQVFITLSDERWVEPTSEQSNERLVRQHFLQHMQQSPHFIALKTEHAHPDQAIANIDARLAELPLPFNLIILGLGADGHIASLFPGMTLDPDSASLCQTAAPPAAPSLRISLSLRALIHSDRIILVITGQEKRQLVDRLIASPDSNIPFVRLTQFKAVELFETD
ncbi:6-phosphogluconolactonase [Nitrosomonas sp. HPC101]|uniref:6-phosphogluconolactonase n=1 Tax=Nitrosomonas sp. HPC101 TaxID=1658667 RepID=UPI0013687B03|nr:6-phosphogluconolactonase [Nitrosomonas sp. HPC101]MXS86169.1 6-phosphogluconolactonase [Nitrosomonas sp. HPC101]